jgi:hypothetical protein
MRAPYAFWQVSDAATTTVGSEKLDPTHVLRVLANVVIVQTYAS